MLKLLTLENFKAFGQRTEIELAPITLIFGQNSAGKSSILQSLNLLKQTYQTPNSDAALLPRVEGGFSDLGSFNELLFDHDTERQLRIGLEVSNRVRHPRTRYFRKIIPHFGNPGIEIGFHRPDQTGDVAVSDIRLFDKDKNDFITFDVKQATEKERETFVAKDLSGRFVFGPGPKYIGTCRKLATNEAFWHPIYEAWLDDRELVVEQLEDALSMTLQRNAMIESKTEDGPRLRGVRRVPKTQIKKMESAIRFYSSDFSFAQFLNRFTKILETQIIGVNKFLPASIMESRAYVDDLPELVVNRGPLARRESRRELPYADVHMLAEAAARTTEHALRNLFPMGPFRRPPERWYIFTGTSPSDVGYRGDHLPDLLFRRPELVEKANTWLERLNIGYKLDVKAVGDRQGDLFEVRLIDAYRKPEVEVALSDVGYGISQILPFIVQSLASERQIISIEQPEVHIHPGLQADLGELIVEATKKPYMHQFLIETHSEHLILRIQKLIRNRKIDAKDVSVLFVSRGAGGSSVERLRLDEFGDFIDDSPGGFFSERLREMR